MTRGSLEALQKLDMLEVVLSASSPHALIEATPAWTETWGHAAGSPLAALCGEGTCAHTRRLIEARAPPVPPITRASSRLTSRPPAATGSAADGPDGSLPHAHVQRQRISDPRRRRGTAARGKGWRQRLRPRISALCARERAAAPRASGEPPPARVTHPGEVRRHLAPVTVSIAPTSTASAAAAMAASLPWPEACKGLSLPDGRSFEWLFQVASSPPPASLPAPPAPGASIPPPHSPDPLPLTPPRPPAERPLALRPAVHRDGAEVAVAHRRRVARLVRLRRRRSSRLSSPP